MTESIFGNYLEERTQKFWNLSSAVNGRIDSTLTAGSAIDAASELRTSLGPQRRLLSSVQRLTDTLIRGCVKPKQKQKKPPSPPVLMKDHKHV